MNKLLIFLTLSFFFYSCHKEYAIPHAKMENFSVHPKKVVYTKFDRKEITEFTYYSPDPNYYPNERPKLAHKVISWPGKPDTIIDMHYIYSGPYPGYLTSLTTSVTTSSGSEVSTEYYTYNNQQQLESYYDGKSNIEYRFYYENTSYGTKIDYILTDTNDSLDVSYTGYNSAVVKSEPCVDCRYAYLEHNNGALEFVSDTTGGFVQDDDLFTKCAYSKNAHTIQKDVWNAFGPKSDIAQLLYIVTSMEQVPLLPFAIRYSSSVPQFEYHYRYDYSLDLFHRIKTINVYNDGAQPAPPSNSDGVVDVPINPYHNYSLYY